MRSEAAQWPLGSAALSASRGLLAFIITVAVSACALPTHISSYEALRAALHAGDHVEIITTGASLSGVVVTMSTSSVTVMNAGTRREIPRGDIVRLQKLDRPWRRNAAIGLAIGGGTGGAIAGFSDCPAGHASCESTRAAGVTGSALLGAGIGAVAGMARRPTVVYDPPAAGAVVK